MDDSVRKDEGSGIGRLLALPVDRTARIERLLDAAERIAALGTVRHDAYAEVVLAPVAHDGPAGSPGPQVELRFPSGFMGIAV